ncbi:MAG TPA: hypothetical protein VMP03_14795 [Methylomirabilota bacterium]|nr:hypothetical protein [Methylomirabilota bacterium]
MMIVPFRFTVAVLALAPILAASDALADCTCRLSGGELPLGALVCLAPNGAAGLYRCSMNLNITSWQRVGDSCPSATLAPPRAPRAHPETAAGSASVKG